MLAALSVFTLVAVASCGDDDDTSNATTTREPTPRRRPARTRRTTETTEGDTAETTRRTPKTDDRRDRGHGGSRATLPGLRVADEGEPVKGGTLVYGLDSDTANLGALPRALRHQRLRPLAAVSDSLFAVSDEGETVPLLVESVENNADYTEWTLHIREGIKFHDGTPLDGEAVKFNIDTCRATPR